MTFNVIHNLEVIVTPQELDIIIEVLEKFNVQVLHYSDVYYSRFVKLEISEIKDSHFYDDLMNELNKLDNINDYVTKENIKYIIFYQDPFYNALPVGHIINQDYYIEDEDKCYSMWKIVQRTKSNGYFYYMIEGVDNDYTLNLTQDLYQID